MELSFPGIINSRSDTWIMTGHGVMHNGVAFIYHYGQNLDNLKVGDRVGVMKNDSSILHFYVNGEDQGDVTILSEGVYGLINLYGEAIEATIVDNFKNNLTFHYLHGKKAKVTNNGLTATKSRKLEIFNKPVVVGYKTIGNDKIFQGSIHKIIDSGQKDIMIQEYQGENVSNQQTTFVIEGQNWDSVTSITNEMEPSKEFFLQSKFAFMEEDFCSSGFHNHKRNVELIKSFRFDWFKIEIKSKASDDQVPNNKKNFKEIGNEETLYKSEFKPQIEDLDLDDSCLTNCICFIQECCQCTIL